MKKRIIFAIGGLAVAIVGAGVLGGTYTSYSNYQKIESFSNNLETDFDAITVDSWNQMDINARKVVINYAQTALNSLNSTNSSDSSSSNTSIKNALTTITSLDSNSNADQGGVIGGSIVLVIGLIILIASLVVKRKKVNN